MSKRAKRWRRRSDGQIAHVLGVIENYVVARWKGYAPWLMPERQFRDEFEPVAKEAS